MWDKAQAVMDDPKALPQQKAQAQRGQMMLAALERKPQTQASNSLPQASSQSASDSA